MFVKYLIEKDYDSIDLEISNCLDDQLKLLWLIRYCVITGNDLSKEYFFSLVKMIHSDLLDKVFDILQDGFLSYLIDTKTKIYLKNFEDNATHETDFDLWKYVADLAGTWSKTKQDFHQEIVGEIDIIWQDNMDISIVEVIDLFRQIGFEINAKSIVYFFSHGRDMSRCILEYIFDPANGIILDISPELALQCLQRSKFRKNIVNLFSEYGFDLREWAVDPENHKKIKWFYLLQKKRVILECPSDEIIHQIVGDLDALYYYFHFYPSKMREYFQKDSSFFDSMIRCHGIRICFDLGRLGIDVKPHIDIISEFLSTGTETSTNEICDFLKLVDCRIQLVPN